MLDGNHGVMMVSKKPIENKDILKFDAFLVQHAALYGEVDGFQIICTHLAAATFLPYAGAFNSYEG